VSPVPAHRQIRLHVKGGELYAIMTRKNILLIDDEPLIVASLFRFLSGKGFDVVTTNSPVAALTLIRMHKFDVVITDLNMTPVNGTEIIGRLHESDFPGKIMLISTCRNAGNARHIDAFFEKPFELSDVYQKIREWTQ